jgi:restriction endonuclease S subunit
VSEGAKVVQLQDFCRIVQGGRLGLSGNDFVPNGFPAYGAGGLNGYLREYEFDEPAVVLSAIGARCGKCFYADGKWTSLANTQLIFPDPARADAKFLWYQLNDEARWHRSGTGQPFIKPADVKTHRVYLPPLPEQRRIAAILDKADELRAKRRAALKKLDELTESIFLDMFGRPNENPKMWPMVSLTEICFPKQWPTIPTSKLTNTGFPVFGANGLIGYYMEYNHERPTVLITCRGATCGTVNVSPPKCYVTGNAMALDDIDEGRVTNEYLAAVLRARGLTDAISGTAQPQITRQSLAHVKLPLPPLFLQNDFASRVAQIQIAQSCQRKSLRQLDRLFASLQHRAFRGEL